LLEQVPQGKASYILLGASTARESKRVVANIDTTTAFFASILADPFFAQRVVAFLPLWEQVPLGKAFLAKTPYEYRQGKYSKKKNKKK